MLFIADLSLVQNVPKLFSAAIWGFLMFLHSQGERLMLGIEPL